MAVTRASSPARSAAVPPPRTPPRATPARAKKETSAAATDPVIATAAVATGNVNEKVADGTPAAPPPAADGSTGPVDYMQESFPETPKHITVLTLFSLSLMYMWGHVVELFLRLGLTAKGKIPTETRKNAGFVPLFKDFESFYTRHLYRRIRDCWNRPIASLPGAYFDLVERVSHDHGWTLEETGEKTRLMNLGSYNYLGFAQAEGPCVEAAVASIHKYGLSTCSPRVDAGTTDRHVALDRLVAEFVGKEDALCFGMGFATNSANLPVLAEPGCLIISDELNHASLVLGCRLSGAKIQVFRHNDMEHLESILRHAVVSGQPRTHRPYKKILIVVEGIYSMEGSVVNLPEVVRLKKKYKAYLYLDEAHSIGALGATGRGVTELLGVSVDDVDIMMGTFTKSFGAAGGYVAGSRDVVAALRATSYAHNFATAMAAPVVEQVVAAMEIIMGRDGSGDGQRRIRQLAFNARYFRTELKKMGLIVYGNDHSPIVPLLLLIPGKIAAFSRLCKDRGLAVVVVGYPATPVNEGRTRFCLSAAHSKEDMDLALEKIADVCRILGLNYLD